MHSPSVSTIERLQHLVEKYGGLALPARMAIGAMVSLVAGTGLGFFAEYAAYSWAIYYGIRPPLEGIPYLKLAVTTLTVTILLGGALVFGLVQAACGYVIGSFESYVEKVSTVEKITARFFPSLAGQNVVTIAVARVREVRSSIAVPGAAVVALLSITPALFVTTKQEMSALPLGRWLEFAALSLLIFFALILAWRPAARAWIAIAAVLFFVVSGPLALFNVHVYGELLRSLGYGGGLSVAVAVVEEKSDLNTKTRIVGSLLLRTTSALLIYQPAEGRVREIPLSQVIYVDHSAVPIRDRRLALPP